MLCDPTGGDVERAHERGVSVDQQAIQRDARHQLTQGFAACWVCNPTGNADMKPAPDFGSSVSIDFVRGLSTVDETMLIILDIDKMLSSDELNISR